MKELLLTEDDFWDLLLNQLGWCEKDYASVLNLLGGLFWRKAEECKKEGYNAIARLHEHDFNVIYSYLKERGYYNG